MGQMKVREILRFPNDDGFLFNHIWGKTLRGGDSNVFGIRRNPQIKICPVQGIEQYMTVAQQLQVDLTKGYLFRPTTPQGGILDAPFSSSAVEARLKGYLKKMGSDNGETLRGFRAGCAITLALSGADLSEIMDHVGSTRRHTALYYLQLFHNTHHSRSLLLRYGKIDLRATPLRFHNVPLLLYYTPTKKSLKKSGS